MENQEDEFVCSDCGATVPADATRCNNCGAVLEDVIDEENLNKEKFVEIPITSHPVNLPSILSMLDEKKIEYSINVDSMENIWGPNFIQLPRLLIRENQYEIVKEIISDFESKDIKIINKSVSSDEPTENNIPGIEDNDEKKSMTGLEGWLLFFCLMLLLGPIAYLPYNINSYLQIKDEINWISLTELFINIDLIATILISCMSVYAGWQLWKIHPGAIKITKYFLNTVLIYSLLFFLMITIILSLSDVPFNSISRNIFGDIIKETISSITYVIVWKLYLQNSERVKNTYGLENSISKQDFS